MKTKAIKLQENNKPSLNITRDPLVRDGAFMIEGTVLSVVDVLHFLFKDYAYEMGILDEILQVVRNWLYEIAPEYMEDCLTREKRTVQFRMRCLKALTQIVRQLELKKKKQELEKLWLLLMQEKKLSEKEFEIKRWYEVFMARAKEQEIIRLVEEEIKRVQEELKMLEKNIAVDKVLLCKSGMMFKPCW